MKNLLIIFLLFSLFSYIQAQDVEYKEYSYTELFQMIEEETDTVFELSENETLEDRNADKK